MSSNNPKVLRPRTIKQGSKVLGQGGGLAKSLITTPTRSQGLGECLGEESSLVEKTRWKKSWRSSQ